MTHSKNALQPKVDSLHALTAAGLLAVSGPRSPYPGRLGVVDEGAPAYFLLIDGNPLDDIKLIADPGKNFKVIMKDGKIRKNTVR